MNAPRPLCLAALGVAALAVAACGAEQPAGPAAASFELRAVAFPGGPGSGQPHLSSGAAPVLSWLEPAGDDIVLRYAPFAGGAFGQSVEVTRGDDLFVNWADLPSVQPITADVVAAHWLKLAPDSSGAYHIATAVSRDGGATFSAPVQLNDDSAEAEHGFVRLFAWEGAIGAVWLDGRALAEWSFDEPDKLLGTSLRVAKLDYEGTVTERTVVDELVCDCCQPHVAMTSAGPLIAYRDRTPEEIRDIAVRRYRDGRWLEPVLAAVDGWHIEGCPVNGPAIAADGERVAVAWFTAAEGRPRLRFAWSSDGAASFAPALDLDTQGAFGQPSVLIERDGAAIVTWWRAATGEGMDLAIRSVGTDGALGEVRVLAHSAAAQPVDVPQVAKIGDELLVVWTSLEGEGAVHALLAAHYR
jgi:hypothetical protein